MRRRMETWLDATADPRPLGVTRIVLGIAAALMTLEIAEAVIRVADGTHLQVPVVPNTGWLRPLSVAAIPAWLVAAGLFAVGRWTRVAGTALVALVLLLLLTDQQLYSNHLVLLGALVGLVTLGDGGAAISLDARGRPPRRIAAWPIWLLRLQITTVYAYSAIAKLNPSFLSGSVVASYLRSDGPLALPDQWRSFELMFAASVLVILLEGLLAIGLWLPYWRRTAFVAGLALHVGIVAFYEPPLLPFVTFGLASLAPYVLFLDAHPGSKLLIWDRGCEFCGGWVRAARRLDWLGVLRYAGNEDEQLLARHGISRQAADAALHLVDAHATRVGYDAVRGVADVLPLTFLWAPLLGLPPVRWVGDRVYRWVARRRSCSIARPPEAAP